MMSIQGFGISLERLSRADLELVRRWRNDPEISRYMFFREHITREMQEAWFETIDNPYNHYFLIVCGGERIGLSHVKNCDYERKCGEGGIFIWAPAHRNSICAYRVVIVGTDWCFDTLGLETITGRVRKDNRRAIRFNLGLGSVFDPEVSGSEVLTCRLTRKAYEAKRPFLVAAVQ